MRHLHDNIHRLCGVSNLSEKTSMHKILISLLLTLFCTGLYAQDELYPYDEPKNYEIGGLTVSGNDHSDEKAIISISGLKVGQNIKLPGSDLGRAIKKLYRLKLFSQVEILLKRTIGDVAMLEIKVTEKPRYSRHSFQGVKKSHHEDLNDIIKDQIQKNSILTEDIKANIIRGIENYYYEKAYLDTKVTIHEFEDEKKVNAVRLVVDIDRGKRVKVSRIRFDGNESFSDRKLRRKMKNTNTVWKLFSKSKYIEKDFEVDKKSVRAYYREKGYRNMQIVSDSIWRNENGNLNIHMVVDEGSRFYFRDISFKGNTLHDEKKLKNILGIRKGDPYNADLLEKRLRFSPDGRDVSSLYMDDGYLFFRADPVETGVIGDSVDVEIRIFEGKQATIDKVVIRGNDRTNEHVIRRELRTLPGSKFSRSDIIRSQRQILALGYFNQENLGINTPVNPTRSTVDIEYTVEEKPSDQLELSAGYSSFGLIGTLGVVFNNFSTRNFFKKSAWKPLPQGDGQKLSLRAQSNGRFYQSYNFSFTEPWLGGKKPNALTVGGYFSLFNDFNREDSKYISLRGYVGLGTRLNWPDDYFISNTQLTLEQNKLQNFAGFNTDNEVITDGVFNNFYIKQTISRSTISEQLFPRSGSRLSLSGQFTLPYSLFKKNFNPDNQTTAEKYKWLEYHKWRFDGEYYYNLVGKLVAAFNFKLGYLGYYNKKLGAPPFERVAVGGDGLNNQSFTITGRDIISLRGYTPEDVRARTSEEFRLQNSASKVDGTIFNKFTIELRYPLSLNPASTIYAHIFAQGGNQWYNFKEYNPFELKRSIGVGVRVHMPFLGLLGFDYGYGLDKPWLTEQDAPLKNYGRFSLILGFEPE